MAKPTPLHHPIHPLIAERWSPVAFSDQPVDPVVVRALLEAARWAPSAYNEQPWAYLVAIRQEPEAYARLLGCLVPGNQAWAQHAPVLMIGLARTRLAHNGKPNRHALHDLGQASALLTVEATVHGLQVHQMGGIDAEAIAERFGLPEDVEAVTGLAIGYPGDPTSLPEPLASRDRSPRARKPQQQFVFGAGWGEAW
jgi:nitroreductase